MSRCIRVCHVTSVHSVGDARIFHKECRSLAEAGYKVCLVAPATGRCDREGVRILGVGMPRGRLERMTRTVWAAMRVAVGVDADIYHLHDFELVPLGVLLLCKRKKVVYDIHEDLPRTILSKGYLPRWSRQIISRAVEIFENVVKCLFSLRVAATPAIGSRFLTAAGPTVVVQNFPRREEFEGLQRPNWSGRPLRVAYVGGISENRGIREMVTAMSLLPKTVPATLCLAGFFSPDSLRREIARLPGWSCVREMGYLGRAEVAALLGQARAGLVVLAPEPRFQVAYPVKLFEYMAAGIPVIASDFPLWREIVEGSGCGLVVPPRDSEAIAEAIARLLSNDWEAETMGRKGREAVITHFNWSTEEQKLLRGYAAITCGAGDGSARG